MSEPTFARFPHSPIPSRDNDAHAAHQARQRIAKLPDPYLEHATPTKEGLVGAVKPVSPAAEGDTGRDPAGEPAAAPAAAPAAEAAALAAVVSASASAAVTNPLATPSETATADTASATMEPEPRRSLPSRLRPVIIGLATFVILYFVFQPQLLLSQLNYLTHPKATPTPATQAAAVVSPNPTISIPKISVNAPVVYATSNDENAILTDLESGVVHYADTALPGQPGNSVIFGHSSNNWWEPGNYKFVFVLLDKLVPGDTFTVDYNSHQYIYQVTSTTVVDPTDVAVLDQTSDPEMTLITCSPPGTSWKRLVVVAKQISPAATTVKPTVTTATPSGAGTLPSNSPNLNDDLSSWWQDLKGFFGGSKQPSETPTTSSSQTPQATIPATQ
jgi:LPXTG-site transpeptidase (sortase) family protein